MHILMAVEGVIDIKRNLLDHNPLRCVLQKNAYKNVAPSNYLKYEFEKFAS
jgi:hypothetical protein